MSKTGGLTMKSNSKIITEYSSKELLELSRKDTPERFQRRLLLGRTRVTSATLDYETGNAIIELNTHDHDQTIEIEDFIGLVAEEILTKYKDGIPRTQLMRIVNVAIRLLLEDSDILVDCDCDDYKFRFNWLAKQYGFALRDRIQGYDYEPKKTNSRLAGGICKHLTKCLSRESQWAEMASRKLINQLLEYDTFLDIIIEPDPEPDEVLFDEDYDKLIEPTSTSSYRSAYTNEAPPDTEVDEDSPKLNTNRIKDEEDEEDLEEKPNGHI